MPTLTAELRTVTYTPAVCAHLKDLRRSYAVGLDLCRHRIEECEDARDTDGVRIAQIDLTLTSQNLATVTNHLSMANREWTR